MQFGFTLKPDHSIERTLALTRQAEAAGFDYGWLFDSHVLWRDPYPLLTLMAQATTRLRPLLAWGRSALDAVHNSVALEAVAQMALNTLRLNPDAELPDYVLQKHFQRKHGPKAYYGQTK